MYKSNFFTLAPGVMSYESKNPFKLILSALAAIELLDNWTAHLNINGNKTFSRLLQDILHHVA